MFTLKISLILLIGLTSTVNCNNATNGRGLLKRSYRTFDLSGYGDGESFGIDGQKFDSVSLGPWNGFRSLPPSPMEVAQAIAAAKQASANVLIAQQQVQAAKENVLQQQKIAMEKEAHSAILTQKSEAAAAIQRSEAAAAAQSVILAQQRLASAKSTVAHQQRIAAAKEAQAAAALHNSAHAAAAEIRRAEQHAARLASLQRTGAAAAAHHVAATKDSSIGSISAGNNHVPNIPIVSHLSPVAPWNNGDIQFGGNGEWPVAQSLFVPTAKSALNVWG